MEPPPRGAGLLTRNYGDGAFNRPRCFSSVVAFGFGRPQRPRGHPLNAGEKAIVAERPADTFGGAQAVHRNSLGWISIRQPAPR
jgi:hypothetical protein